MDGSCTGRLRLVLIGSSESGKSASANTIMGRILFQSRMSASSVTHSCQRETTDITVEEDGEEDGGTVTVRRRRRVTVVDTPGLGDTRFSEDQIHTEIARAVILSAPGPHAFLLVVPIGAYTENENQAASQFTRMFGEEAVRHHTVVLFTKGDELELDNTTIEEYLRGAPESLRALINRCGGRYHVFNNRDRNNSAQVRDLLMKVDNMVMQNNNRFYINAMQCRVPQRVKTVVAAVVTGLAVGAALAATITFVISAAVSTTVRTTTLAVGAGVGAVVGGVTGARVAAGAESPGEAALETLEQVLVLGSLVVGTAADVL
ncbi:uncharacterized protein V6R79_022102 [Siganus canaliculatus]